MLREASGTFTVAGPNRSTIQGSGRRRRPRVERRRAHRSSSTRPRVISRAHSNSRARQALMTAHPDIAVRLHELHSAEQLESVRQGFLDMAILREAVVDPSFVSLELVREPFVLLAPSSHAQARRRSVSLTRYAAEPFILLSRRTAPTLYDQIVAICRDAGFEPQVVHEAYEWHTIAALVGAGLGMSIAPASVAALRIRVVTTRRLHAAGSRAVLFLLHPADGLSEAARRFARFARANS